MKFASCIDDDCGFCFSSLMEDKHGRATIGFDRSSKATMLIQEKTDHKISCRATFEAEVLFHRGFTSIDRGLVNPAALEEANRRFTESKNQRFIIAHDALTEAEVEALVIRTATIRNARKQKKDLRYKEKNGARTQADGNTVEHLKRKERMTRPLTQFSDEKQRSFNPLDTPVIGAAGQSSALQSPMSPSEKRILILPQTDMSLSTMDRGTALSKKLNTRHKRRVYPSQHSRVSRVALNYAGSPSTSSLVSRQGNNSEAPGRSHASGTRSKGPHVAGSRKKQSSKSLASKRSRRSLLNEVQEPRVPDILSQGQRQTLILRQESARTNTTRLRKIYETPESDKRDFNPADISTPTPTRRVTRQQSYPASVPDGRWSEDPADIFDNPFTVAQKTSAWFKKFLGGRKSAPPNESVTAASRRVLR